MLKKTTEKKHYNNNNNNINGDNSSTRTPFMIHISALTNFIGLLNNDPKTLFCKRKTKQNKTKRVKNNNNNTEEKRREWEAKVEKEKR